MGLIKMALNSMPGQMAKNGIVSSYQDMVLEYFRCEDLSDEYLMVPATQVKREGAVNRGSEGVITNGSIFDVAVNQAAVLIENGRVHDFVIGVSDGQNDTTGRYKYDSSLEPSLISGGFGDVLPNLKAQGLNALGRMQYGGQATNTMRLVYFNLKEIKLQKIGIGGVSFYDNRYNFTLELRGHGTFTYRITDPVSFYQNMAYDPRKPLRSADILEELRNNISTVLDPSIGAIESVCPRGYVDIKNHSHELAGFANKYLVERGTWKNRGISLVEISLQLGPTDEFKAKISKLEESQVYSNPGMAAGLNALGMNAAMTGIGEGAAKGGGTGDSMGAMMGMMGMTMMNNMANQQYQNQYAQQGYAQIQQGAPFNNPYGYQQNQGQPMQAPPYINQQNGMPQGQQQFAQQPTQQEPPVAAPVSVVQEQPTQTQEMPKMEAPKVGWTCPVCGNVSQGKFCMECGSKKPADAPLYRCDKCGWVPDDPHHPPKFCPECGDKFDENDVDTQE